MLGPATLGENDRLTPEMITAWIIATGPLMAACFVSSEICVVASASLSATLEIWQVVLHTIIRHSPCHRQKAKHERKSLRIPIRSICDLTKDKAGRMLVVCFDQQDDGDRNRGQY